MIKWICDYLPPINLWNVWSMNDTRCEICGFEMEVFAGESAHKSNWFCPNEAQHPIKKKKKDNKEICINYEIDEYYEQRKRN